jgi:hypothetical protein
VGQLKAPFSLALLPCQGEGLPSALSDLNGLGLRILLKIKNICPGPVSGSESNSLISHMAMVMAIRRKAYHPHLS